MDVFWRERKGNRLICYKERKKEKESTVVFHFGVKRCQQPLIKLLWSLSSISNSTGDDPYQEDFGEKSPTFGVTVSAKNRKLNCKRSKIVQRFKTEKVDESFICHNQKVLEKRFLEANLNTPNFLKSQLETVGLYCSKCYQIFTVPSLLNTFVRLSNKNSVLL